MTPPVTQLAEAYEENASELLCYPEKKEVQSPPDEVFIRIEVTPPPANEETLEIIAIAASSPSYDFLKEEY
jgi:hypothetical protein